MAMADIDYDKLNKVQRYSQWAVFHVAPGILDAADGGRAAVARDAQEYLDRISSENLVVRGVYLVSGVQAEADFVIWWHAEEFSTLQTVLNGFRRETALGQMSDLVWCGNGVHRPSEFNKRHLPGFIMGMKPKKWITVYPFVRSYDWYLLEPEKRAKILADHGRQASTFPDVWANTVEAFTLGDYEWMLCFEADDVGRIVDLMHTMRYTEARLHVREETPFYTGQRLPLSELVERLP